MVNSRGYKPLYINLLFLLVLSNGGFNMTEASRPLDALNRARDKRVIVELKNKMQYIGNLKAFDIHINVVLENAEEYGEGELKRKLGVVFIRGDTITVISPQ
jgi:small nuclear ribonucleoprotein